MGRATSSVVVVMLVVMLVVMGGNRVQGKVDYNCLFGPMLSVEDQSGTMHQFCETEMNPPFLPRGEYLQAVAVSGKCYECVCEEVVGGMACCETECI